MTKPLDNQDVLEVTAPQSKWDNFDKEFDNGFDDEDDADSAMIDPGDEEEETEGDSDYESDSDDESDDVTEDEEEADEEFEEDRSLTTKEVKGQRKPDKVQSALIQSKREIQELKRQLAEKEAKDAEEKIKLQEQMDDNQEVAYLVEQGFDENMAKYQVQQKRENARLSREVQRIKFGGELSKLESKCPGIRNHEAEIYDLHVKSGMTPEEIWRGRFSHESQSDITNKARLEAQRKLQKGQEVKTPIGTQTKAKGDAKLNPAEEKQYQFLLKRGSKMTRKEFKKYSG